MSQPLVIFPDRAVILAHYLDDPEPIIVESCAVNHVPERLCLLSFQMGPKWTVIARVPLAPREKLGFQKRKASK